VTWHDRDGRPLKIGDRVRWEDPDAGGLLDGLVRTEASCRRLDGQAVIYLPKGPEGFPTVRSVPWTDLWAADAGDPSPPPLEDDPWPSA
jgi:hypothetical protein